MSVGRRISTSHPRPGAAGFTLIEVLLVIAIIAFVTLTMWSSFSQAVTSKKRVEAAQERTHTVRVALMRMAREIEMAFLSENESVLTQMPRTMLVGASRPDVDDLTFSAFAHQRLRGGVGESDTSLIRYFGERDPEQRGVLNLMRRETRRLQAAPPGSIPGESYVLCPDITRLKLNYWDYRKKEWREEWSTTVVGYDYLPTHVRISLTVLDERQREITFSTDARTYLNDKVGWR
jgi:general secretion pathway protein J